MSKHEVVSIIFRLINFAITVGAGYYLFKRYGLSLIQDKIKQKKDYLDELDHQAAVIADTHQNLISQQKYQTILFEQLKFKLSLWNTAYQKMLGTRKNEKDEIKKKLEQKVHMQNSYLAQQSLKRQIFVKAIDQARTILENKFMTPSSGKKYLNPILIHIKKSTSE